jgi:hypothetical protein
MVAALDCLWRDQSLEKSVGNLVNNLWETARRTCGSTCVFAEQDPPDVCGVRGDDPVDIPCKRLLVSQLRQHGEKCDVAAKESFVRDRAGDQWQRSLSNRGHGSREDFRLVELTKPNWPRGHEGASQAARSFQDAHPSCAIRRARYGRGSRPCRRSLAAIRDLPGRPAFARVDGDLPLQGRAHRRGLGHPYSRRMARLVRETVSSLWIASGKTGELR